MLHDPHRRSAARWAQRAGIDGGARRRPAAASGIAGEGAHDVA